MAKMVNRIMKALELPTNALLAETRQLIDGKLAEAYGPRNVRGWSDSGDPC